MSDEAVVVTETGQVVVREPQTRVVQTQTAQVIPQETEVKAVAAQWLAGDKEVYIQDNDPGDPLHPAIWIQTGLGPGGSNFDLKFWRE